MNKMITLVFLLTIGFISCKTSEKKIDNLEIAKKYYEFLNNSNSSEMASILSDSIVIRESQDDYEENFSQKGYVEWLEWDSVFKPTYKILQIEQENGVVKSKISKIDQRIFFLHEEPMIWNEIIRFDNNKIVRVERIGYEVFNLDTFLKNRENLLKWVNENHPELKGFLYDQTEAGGKKYLKAIELYKNK